MGRWSRPVGLLLSSLFVVGVVLVVLLGGDDGLPQPEGPPPDLRNGRVFIQDNLWTAGNRQYAVWVGHDGTPYAGSRPASGGEWNRTVNLGRLAGNPLAAPTANDNHNVYSLGVDSLGRVHIAGNMKGDPLRYVHSGRGGLGDWTAAGGPDTAPRVAYPAFVVLPDETLLFFRREVAVGEGAAEVVDVLRPGARSWASLGAVIDGRPSGESAYLHRVAVDPASGAIHLMFEWRGDADPNTTNDVGYARSLDGGRSWETGDGTPLPTPITHATAETVIDTPPTGSGVLNQGGLTVDTQGRPHGVVLFNRPGGDEAEHVWLENGTWRREPLDDADLDGRAQLAATSDGRVWLIGVSGTLLRAIDITPDREHEPTQELARVPRGWEPTFDSQALWQADELEILVPRGDEPAVAAADLGS